VLALGFTPAYSARDLLLQHLDALEQEALVNIDVAQQDHL
jgi:hypothetical protein